MCSAGFIYTVLIIFAIVLIVQCEDRNYFEDTLDPDEIIDPHSFYYDKRSKTMIKEDTKAESINLPKVKDSAEQSKNTEQDAKYIQVDKSGSHEAVFYKRLINMLLSNINIQVKDEVSVVGILEIEISHSQMEILQNFHIQKTSLREIDEILSNVIRKPRTDYMGGIKHGFDVLFTKLDTMFRTVREHPDAAVILLAILMVFLMFKMIKWGRGFPIFIFIQIIFIMSFFMTWWHLLQEAEVKFVAAQMKFANVPISCQPDKMSMWDKFVSFISASEDCENYYKATMSNPKLKITPAHALSHFLTTVILHPITHMGTVVSGFIHNATDDLPWTYAWIIKCMLFLCIGFVIIILPFCLSGASFNFGLGPLLRFGIDYQRKERGDKKNRKGNSLENVKKRDPVQIILQVPHGTNVPAIENAPVMAKSRVMQISKNNTEKEQGESSDGESDDHDLREDLSCGDTLTNAEPAGNDCKENKQRKKLDEIKTKKNDGGGDG